jgi:hypothetical protein
MFEIRDFHFNLSGVIYDARTRWPRGFDPLKHGTVQVR